VIDVRGAMSDAIGAIFNVKVVLDQDLYSQTEVMLVSLTQVRLSTERSSWLKVNGKRGMDRGEQLVMPGPSRYRRSSRWRFQSSE
jgi:hypothetical protein